MNPESSTPTEDELSALLARVGLGDRAAFETLYRRTSPRLLGVVMRVLPQRAQAEEVLQELFVKVWRGASAYDAARAQALTWLTALARNAAIDALRHTQARIQTESLHREGPAEGDSHDLADAIASEGAGPLELLESAAERRQVTHCVDALSVEQKQCVALAYYHGLSHSEVARHLAQPLGSVKAWIRRALMALRDCLGRSAVREA